MGRKKSQKEKIILPPELPPEISEDEIEVSDDDLQFVDQNRDYAGFVSRLDTQSITKFVSLSCCTSIPNWFFGICMYVCLPYFICFVKVLIHKTQNSQMTELRYTGCMHYLLQMRLRRVSNLHCPDQII